MTAPSEQPAAQFNPGPMPPNLNVGAQIVPGPNGAPLVAIVMQYGYTNVALTVDDKTAEQLASLLPQVLAAALAEIKRIRTGLVVAGPDALRGLPPINGNGRPH